MPYVCCCVFDISAGIIDRLILNPVRKMMQCSDLFIYPIMKRHTSPAPWSSPYWQILNTNCYSHMRVPGCHTAQLNDLCFCSNSTAIEAPFPYTPGLFGCDGDKWDQSCWWSPSRSTGEIQKAVSRHRNPHGKHVQKQENGTKLCNKNLRNPRRENICYLNYVLEPCGNHWNKSSIISVSYSNVSLCVPWDFFNKLLHVLHLNINSSRLISLWICSYKENISRISPVMEMMAFHSVSLALWKGCWIVSFIVRLRNCTCHNIHTALWISFMPCLPL